MALTPKQLRFIDEYMVCLNASSAATKAGYSPRTANEQGSQLLRNTKVSAEIAKRRLEQASLLKIKKEDILNELAKIAFFNSYDLILSLKNNEPPSKQSLIGIKSISIGPKGINFSLNDRIRSLELLLLHLGYSPKSPVEQMGDQQAKTRILERIKNHLKTRMATEQDGLD